MKADIAVKAVIRWMMTAFYRPNYQKLLMCPLIKWLDRAFVSITTFDRAFERLSRAIETLAELLNLDEKTKSSTVCLCYNTTHAVAISHDKN